MVLQCYRVDGGSRLTAVHLPVHLMHNRDLLYEEQRIKGAGITQTMFNGEALILEAGKGKSAVKVPLQSPKHPVPVDSSSCKIVNSSSDPWEVSLLEPQVTSCTGTGPLLNPFKQAGWI